MTAEQRLKTGKRPQRNPPSSPRGTDEPARSTRKARQAYPDEVRLEVLRRLRAGASIADEHKRTGVAKGTLSRWARTDGIDLGEEARARTAKATERVRELVTEARQTTVTRLEAVLEQELDAHAQRLRLEHALATQLAAALAGDLQDRTGDVFRLMRGETAATVMLRDPDSELAQIVAALELLNITSPKRDTVGAWTRAVHDLALLKGEATERGAVVVQFGIPRPDTTVVPVPQQELGR